MINLDKFRPSLYHTPGQIKMPEPCSNDDHLIVEHLTTVPWFETEVNYHGSSWRIVNYDASGLSFDDRQDIYDTYDRGAGFNQAVDKIHTKIKESDIVYTQDSRISYCKAGDVVPSVIQVFRDKNTDNLGANVLFSHAYSLKKGNSNYDIRALQIRQMKFDQHELSSFELRRVHLAGARDSNGKFEYQDQGEKENYIRMQSKPVSNLLYEYNYGVPYSFSHMNVDLIFNPLPAGQRRKPGHAYFQAIKTEMAITPKNKKTYHDQTDQFITQAANLYQRGVILQDEIKKQLTAAKFIGF